MNSEAEHFKHKEAVIVVLAYIIGFTTAAILFGLSGKIEPHSIETKYSVASSAYQSEATYRDVRSLTNEEGLFAFMGNKRDRLLSAAMSTGENIHTYHYSIITTSVSSDDKFIHYCSQNQSSDDFCSHFIYSLNDSKYYPVTNDANQVTSSIENINTYWEEEGYLYLDGLRSVNVDNPWVVE